MADTLVSGSRTNRLTMSGSDRLDVTETGVFSVSGNAQTVRFTAPTSGAVIDNDGLIENTASGGRAIRFETGVGATLNASIVNGEATVSNATIRSDDDAIQIQAGAVTAGKVSITNADGSIIHSTNGQAVDFAGGTGTFETEVFNSGAITSGSNDGVRVGGVGTIDNRGMIDGGDAVDQTESADGIQFEDGASGTVNNRDDASITGDRHGVNAGEDTQITVTNSSVITGRNGSGVGSDGSATVINSSFGVITGGFTAGVDINGPAGEVPDGIFDGDGDGIDIDFYARIENYGVIQGTGSSGNGSDGLANTSEGIAAGGGDITNYAGAYIGGADIGILVDNSSLGNAAFSTAIVNNGEIVGQSSYAIRIVSDLSDYVSNSGLIRGTGGTAILFGSGNNSLLVRDGSQIVGLTEGGLGLDTLDYDEYGSAATVNLETGDATGTGGVTGFEQVAGSDFGDSFTGSDGDEKFIGLLGDDFIDGGDGLDTAFYFGLLADYTVARTATGYTVSGADGFDTLVDIEKLTFHDGTFDIDGLANSAPTDLRLSRTSLAEDTPIWTTLGLLKANDADGDTLSYRLVDDADGLFRIRGERLITSGTFDYETATSHEITVAVSDGTTEVLKSFLINVTDVLDGPVNTTPHALKLSRGFVAENIAIGTSVGLLSAIDDDGDTIKWSLLDNAGSFKLLGNKLVTTAAIDYEATPELTIQVRALDSFGNATVEDFTLAVRDLNDTILA